MHGASSPLKPEPEARSDTDFDDRHVDDGEYETDDEEPDADEVRQDEPGEARARGVPHAVSPSGASAVGAPRQTYGKVLCLPCDVMTSALTKTPTSAHLRPLVRPGASTTAMPSKLSNPLPRYAWPLSTAPGMAPSGVGSGSTTRWATALSSASASVTNEHAAGDGSVRKCLACDETHPVGYCPLKLAGYQRCPLCNLAHVGAGNKCPHLRDEEQLSLIMDGIRNSPEDKETKDLAMQYLRGIKGHLARKRRAETARLEAERVAAAGRAASATGSAVRAPPTGVFDHPAPVSRAPAGTGRGHGLGRGPGHGSGHDSGQIHHPGQGHHPGGPAFGIHIPTHSSSTHNTFIYDPSVPAHGTSLGSQGVTQRVGPSVHVSAAGPPTQQAPFSAHAVTIGGGGAREVGPSSHRPSLPAASATPRTVPGASTDSGHGRGGARGGARGGTHVLPTR